MSEEKTEGSPFKAGELVQHVAGGPLMAFVFYDEACDGYVCTWIWRGQRRKDRFQLCELKRPDAQDLDTRSAIASRPEGSSLVAR